ncbi:insulin receptor substrate 1-like [Phyllopteryx taeniolatus]|uniref:insulin receptor substrate 1-like n=1 Tax=Phyllopteryx taeniolatus TaxID=161469 RepID=UPI002AD33C29|nr:insulin receptor substrate 1-like [Phyllopteryx taeniolatus]XP_061632285.1 insulin receptor substrate 1-like [Phyllopteryx taeniolatus]
MTEMVDGYNRRAAGPEQTLMATESSCGDCQTQIRGGEVGHHVGVQVTPFDWYEEFFCSSHTSVRLLSALATSSGQRSDVVKQGYLGKLERSHRRYFVLRAGSHTGPSRLEWYKSEEKFAAMEKSSGKTTLFGPSKQGVIFLRCCIGVGCLGSSRKGLTVALYAQDQTMVLVAEDQRDQEAWYLSIKKMMEERSDEDQACDDEDDGYCTLPPAAFFKEVWPVSVKAGLGLGRSKTLAGELRLCLTATSLILIPVGACPDLPSVTIPLPGIRRFGHLDGSFFLELGRTAPIGPGEIWFEARDQAQHIHEVVRDTVRALRALPDFSRSPTSNHNQLLAPKRCRPKYRQKKNPDVQTPCQEANATEPQSPLSLRSLASPEHDRYMDMSKRPGGDGCSMGGEAEGVGYVMMSPQVSRTSCALPQDAYVAMSSPQKQDRPASVSPGRGVNRCSPHQATDGSRRTSSYDGRLPLPFGFPWSPKERTDPPGPMTPFVQSSRLQAGDRLAVRSRLSSCLPSCLQAYD